MDIKNSELIDIDFIFEMYKVATEYQKQRVIDIWPEFDKEMVKNEIIEKRQFKLIIKNQIVCVWAVTFDDPYIWGEKNNSKSIYIHRLATHQNHRGNNFALKLVGWAKEYALKNDKKYIRLDTVGHNKKLINKIECPVGMEIGDSKDPEEIAFSIITRLISIKNT